MPYLTAEEYLARFSQDETANLTDPSGATIDEDRLAVEIAGASNNADAYIASRYTVPLSPVPEVVKDIVADLTRERLYNLHPVEEVTSRADRARTMLKDISKGVMVLVSAGEVVAEDASDLPAAYAPKTIFSDCVLSSYRGPMQ